MDNYEIVKELGDGSFGNVLQAQHKNTGLVVAIKKMKKKFSSWEKVCELREFKSLRGLPSHPNVIGLLEAFLIPQTRELNFVFEFMEVNLYQVIKERKGRPFSQQVVQSIMFQVFQGVYHIHSYGLFHRDLKPENILISTKKKLINDFLQPDISLESKENPNNYSVQFNLFQSNESMDIQELNENYDNIEYIVKIGDFGLVREIKSRPPYTDYVSTRWYRAPEVLLRSNFYSSPIDIWALGAIMVELYTLKPLFPGQSEVDQLSKICRLLGSPGLSTDSTGEIGGLGGGEWKEGLKLAKNIGFNFPTTRPEPPLKIFPPSTPAILLQLIAQLLRYNPSQRLTALGALKHPYFVESNMIFQPTVVQEISVIGFNLTDKKRKNENFSALRKLAQGVNSVPFEKKNTRYSWSKAEETSKQEKLVMTETSGDKLTKDIISLPPLNINAANHFKLEEFVLPSIKAVSPFSSEQSLATDIKHLNGANGDPSEQTLSEANGTLSDFESLYDSIFAPSITGCQAESRSDSSLLGTRLHKHSEYQVFSTQKSITDNFPSTRKNFGHKRSRSNTASPIDQMVKEINHVNNGVNETKTLVNGPTNTIDLHSYQLPDDVIKFFGVSEDSKGPTRKSSSPSRDFMKVHRRYSSNSATLAENSSIYSFDTNNQGKDGFRLLTSSIFCPITFFKFFLMSNKATAPYATRYYGQHLMSWQQMRQLENGTSSINAKLDGNLGTLKNTPYTSSTIDQHQLNPSVSVPKFQLKKPDASTNFSPNLTNGFLSNLRAAVRLHTYSPTKHKSTIPLNEIEGPSLSSSTLPNILPAIPPLSLSPTTKLISNEDLNYTKVSSERRNSFREDVLGHSQYNEFAL
ncbi:hypothetical protein G9A89_020573 [Geosiphon pyriformis]|nr:hypothetical protein G9A89_020573 [Geosiphon pyriformis]